ncbi:unnamed protein product [Caenorhabditis nigoni]
MLTSDGPQFVIYVLLRLFHIFVKIIADKNHGNTDLVSSILRDISHNSWIEFYKKHLHYIKLYTDELSKTSEFKINEEHIIKERKCIITIEYSYPDNSDTTGSKEVKLLNTKQNGTTTFDKLKNAFSPLLYIFGDPRCSPPQKSVEAVQQAPEEQTIEKMTPGTDAEPGNDLNNGTRDDDTRDTNTESSTEDLTTDKEETLGSQQKEINNFGDNRCTAPQKNVSGTQQAPEKPKIEKMAPETDAKTGGSSNSRTRDNGTRDANTESGTEYLTTDKEEILRSQQKEINNFGNNRCQPPQKNVGAVQQAPEEQTIEKMTPGTDAKTGSDSNNSIRDDGTRFSDIGSGGDDPKTDKEDAYEPLTSTKPTNFSMDSEKNPNHTPDSEVPDRKIKASDGMVDSDHHVSERSISVEGILEPNQNEHLNQEIYEPTTSTESNSLFDNFLKDVDSLKPSQLELTGDDSPDDTVNFIGQVTNEVSDIQERTRKTVTGLQTDRTELEERNSILYTPLEEDVDTGNEDFIEKLEELKKKNEEELKRKRQEREEKQRKWKEELREIRRLQKQKFAVLLHCIQLRYRFEEKEAEWSDWIEHCYRRLVVTIITQFSDFLEELGGSEKAFRKVLERSPEIVQSEVTNLCGRMEATLHKLSGIFKNLAKLGEDFEDAVFIRILQKSSCDISIKLISVLNCLDAIEYSIEWYQDLTSKFDHIRTSDVPGVTVLKRLCKEDIREDFKNMEFPKWEPRSHVSFEELASDEEEDVVEYKPENLVEVEKATSDSSGTETKDPEQASQPVEKLPECDSSIPANPELDKEDNSADTDKKIKSTTENQYDDGEKIMTPINELFEEVEPSQSSCDGKSEQNGFQKVIHKHRPSEESVPIAEIEECPSDKEEDVVEDKPENLVEDGKVEVIVNNGSSNEVPESAQRIPMGFLEAGKDMTYQEDSKAASNSDRAETKDPEQVDQDVRLIQAIVELDKEYSCACIDRNVKHTAHSQHDDEQEIGTLVNYQSDFLKTSEQDEIQEAISIQVKSEEAAPIADIEELSSYEEECVAKNESKNLAVVAKVEVGDNMNSGMESLDMTNPESSNGNETKDPEQADKVVRLVPADVELNKEDDCAFIDRNAKHTAHSEHNDEKEIRTPTNYLLGEVEDSQPSIQEKSEQDGVQESEPKVIRMQIYRQKTCENKKCALDLEDPTIPNHITANCSDQEDIKTLLEEVILQVSSIMDDNFENQTNKVSCLCLNPTKTATREKFETLETILVNSGGLERPRYENKSWKKSKKVCYEVRLRRKVFQRSSKKSNKMKKGNRHLSSTTQIDSTEIMKKCLMLYDHLLTEHWNWDTRQPMRITHATCVNNKYPPRLVRIWNEIVKKETKFLERQEIIELVKTKLKKID